MYVYYGPYAIYYPVHYSTSANVPVEVFSGTAQGGPSDGLILQSTSKTLLMVDSEEAQVEARYDFDLTSNTWIFKGRRANDN